MRKKLSHKQNSPNRGGLCMHVEEARVGESERQSICTNRGSMHDQNNHEPEHEDVGGARDPSNKPLGQSSIAGGGDGRSVHADTYIPRQSFSAREANRYLLKPTRARRSTSSRFGLVVRKKPAAAAAGRNIRHDIIDNQRADEMIGPAGGWTDG